MKKLFNILILVFSIVFMITSISLANSNKSDIENKLVYEWCAGVKLIAQHYDLADVWNLVQGDTPPLYHTFNNVRIEDCRGFEFPRSTSERERIALQLLKDAPHFACNIAKLCDEAESHPLCYVWGEATKNEFEYCRRADKKELFYYEYNVKTKKMEPRPYDVAKIVDNFYDQFKYGVIPYKDEPEFLFKLRQKIGRENMMKKAIRHEKRVPHVYTKQDEEIIKDLAAVAATYAMKFMYGSGPQQYLQCGKMLSNFPLPLSLNKKKDPADYCYGAGLVNVMFGDLGLTNSGPTPAAVREAKEGLHKLSPYPKKLWRKWCRTKFSPTTPLIQALGIYTRGQCLSAVD